MFVDSQRWEDVSTALEKVFPRDIKTGAIIQSNENLVTFDTAQTLQLLTAKEQPAGIYLEPNFMQTDVSFIAKQT